MHCRTRRSFDPIAFETAGDLAGAPGRVLIAQSQNALLDRRFDPPGTAMRPARAIRQFFFGHPAAKPLVAGVRMDPEPPAQLPPVRPFLHCKPHKLAPLVHDRHLAPRHGWPSLKAQSMQ